MRIGEIVMNKVWENDSSTLYSVNIDGYGKITVLDRLTGWGDGTIRDIETGFKDEAGKFWLASGCFDIRNHPELSIEDAVTLIKDNANTCIRV